VIHQRSDSGEVEQVESTALRGYLNLKLRGAWRKEEVHRRLVVLSRIERHSAVAVGIQRKEAIPKRIHRPFKFVFPVFALEREEVIVSLLAPGDGLGPVDSQIAVACRGFLENGNIDCCVSY